MIKMSHLFQSLMGVGVLSLYLAAWNPPNAQAQRSSSVPLLSTKCVRNNVRHYTNKVDLSISRELVSSSLQLESSSTSVGLITCQLSTGFSHPFETLQMKFGIPDQKFYNYTVKVFLDQKLTKTQQVRPGELQSLLVDVKGIKNVAIEIQKNRAHGLRGDYPLYFLSLSLEADPTSSLIESNSPNPNSYSGDDYRVILEETKKTPAQIPEPETIQEKINEVEETVDKVNRFLDIFR